MGESERESELAALAMPVLSTVGAALVSVGVWMRWLGDPEGWRMNTIPDAMYGTTPGLQLPDVPLVVLALGTLAAAGYYRDHRHGGVLVSAGGIALLSTATTAMLVAHGNWIAAASDPPWTAGTATTSPAIEPGVFATLAGAGLFVLAGGLQLAASEVATDAQHAPDGRVGPGGSER